MFIAMNPFQIVPEQQRLLLKDRQRRTICLPRTPSGATAMPSAWTKSDHFRRYANAGNNGALYIRVRWV